MFVHMTLDFVFAIHTDDFLASGLLVQNVQTLDSLGKEMLLKVGGPLSEEGSLSNFESLLLPERSRHRDMMVRRVSPCYVLEAAEMLGCSAWRTRASFDLSSGNCSGCRRTSRGLL